VLVEDREAEGLNVYWGGTPTKEEGGGRIRKQSCEFTMQICYISFSSRGVGPRSKY
jgi:hypothetical protein